MASKMYRSAIKISLNSFLKRTDRMLLQYRTPLHTFSCSYSVMNIEKRLFCTANNHSDNMIEAIINDTNKAATVIDSELLKKYDKTIAQYKLEYSKNVERSLIVIKSFNLQPDEEYLYLVVNAYSRTLDSNGILNAFNDIELKGYKKSLHLLNELMFMYHKTNNIKEVENTLLTMKTLDIQPDIRSVNHLLSTILSSPGPLDWNNFIDAYTSYCSPKSEVLAIDSTKLVTDKSIYRILLRACYINKNTEKAIYYLNEALSAGMQPSKEMTRPFYETLGIYACTYV
jgi:pentatricopeptide repeat protein